MTEATHFSQCVHDQQRRLEAEDCDSIRCAQLIYGGRRRIRPPCTVPRSHSPCIRLVYYMSIADLCCIVHSYRLAVHESTKGLVVVLIHIRTYSRLLYMCAIIVAWKL